MKCKLGDYIRIKHGFAFKGEYITAENNGVVLVTPGNFEIGGGFKEDKCKFFNGDYPKEYFRSKSKQETSYSYGLWKCNIIICKQLRRGMQYD